MLATLRVVVWLAPALSGFGCHFKEIQFDFFDHQTGDQLSRNKKRIAQFGQDCWLWTQVELCLCGFFVLFFVPSFKNEVVESWPKLKRIQYWKHPNHGWRCTVWKESQYVWKWIVVLSMKFSILKKVFMKEALTRILALTHLEGMLIAELILYLSRKGWTEEAKNC